MVVSELSFGCSSLGGVFRSVKEQEAIEAVFTAIECGINFLDVSPYYGHYKAETVLGKALKSIPRDKYYLSTKVGRYGKDGVNIWDYSAKRAKESVYESMERLNIDHIDLINVHDIEFQASLPGGLKKVAEETLPALHELKEEGVVGHIGITDLQPENLKWVIDNTESGLVESVLCFCHYCLNDTLILNYLDDFEQKGVGVIAQAAEYCKGVGYPIEKLAMQFATDNPRIATTLFSSANPANVRRNVAYVESETDAALLEAVTKIIEPHFGERWNNT